jgi:hypothetical protein
MFFKEKIQAKVNVPAYIGAIRMTQPILQSSRLTPMIKIKINSDAHFETIIFNQIKFI